MSPFLITKVHVEIGEVLPESSEIFKVVPHEYKPLDLGYSLTWAIIPYLP